MPEPLSSPVPPRPMLDELTTERARASLESCLGLTEGQRLWRNACADAGADANGNPKSHEELERIAEYLSGHGGPVALVGNSLAIRLRTYQMLERAGRLEKFLQNGCRDDPSDGQKRVSS